MTHRVLCTLLAYQADINLCIHCTHTNMNRTWNALLTSTATTSCDATAANDLTMTDVPTTGTNIVVVIRQMLGWIE